ncbi:MAG: Fmu (Sun) domain-containing protein [Chitinophagaceae bacterium]|nr:Fmu (Sun) domain-containing protein [Chitinophagaceae bacterium]
MRQYSYLNSAKKIIDVYDGREPLSIFLKKQFAANKKYGSKDRKKVTALCYAFYRLGKAMPGLSIEEKIITGTFLCEHSSSEFLDFHKPEWNAVIEKPLSGKIDIAGADIGEVFPWKNELSVGIDQHSLCVSFFTQPDLFLRVRPGKKNDVFKKLQDAGLHYDTPDEDCISLRNNTKLDDIIELNKDAVVQDRNSQQVLNVLKYPVSGIRHPVSSIQHPVSSIQHPVSVWDCCAASGGKSLLAYDILNGKIALTVSDIRENILSNLKKRFSAAGIKNYKSFVADLQTPDLKFTLGAAEGQTSSFQLIICDAPCTGSGTWSRTPEQLYFFKEEMIAAYAGTQQKIVSNAIPHLEKGGMFIYITCSVFKKENEAVVNFIKEKFHLRLLQMELLKGYDKKADSMFTAAFIKE